VIELQTMLMRFTVDVTCSLTFGADVNTLQNGGDALQEHIDKIFPKLAHRINMPIPYWRWFTLPADRVFERHLAAAQEAVRGFIQAARARMAAATAPEQNPANLLEAMLAAHDADGGTLTESEVAGNVFTMLLAGEDTTANSLAWSLYLLHSHPEAWRAIVAEADAALGPDLIPATAEATSGLTAIEHATNEAMRLRPVAPLAYLETNRPTDLAGIALPAGTFLIGLMRPGAVDPAIAPDAAAFRPGRWQAPAGAPDQILTAASMPFGAGPRICPGRYLAMLEMKMVLATIARNYDLIEVGTATGAPPKETNAFTMYPAGLRMRLKPRQRA
jgi:cytochrome P450